MTITLGRLKEYIEEALKTSSEDTPVEILFETGFCQYQYKANGCILPGQDRGFILSYELDLLPREEWIHQSKDSYKIITRILKDKLDREDVGLELEKVISKEVNEFFGVDK